MKEHNQITYLDEVRSFSDNKKGEHPSEALIVYMCKNSFDPRMVSEGGFEVYGHLHSCEECRSIARENVKFY